MQDEFSLWRNGHSLVLASNALSRRRVDDLLDLQLLAYLGSDGEMPEIVEITDWRNIYQSLQASMGCAFTSLNVQTSLSSIDVPLQPIEALKKGLTTQFSGLSQALLINALAALDNLDWQLLDALCRECITSGAVGHQFNAELRLLLPGPLIVGSELWFVSATPLTCRCPGWRVEHAALRHSSARTTSYLLDEKLFDSLRDIVDEALVGKRKQYRMAVRQRGGDGRG